MTNLRIRLIALNLGLALAVAAPLYAQSDQQKLVDECLVTWNNFQADPNMTWFREHDHEAVGFLIAEKVVKAGFVFGGSGGRAVLVAKGEKGWAGPAFYTLGTASAGFQAGVDVSEVIVLVMNKKALDKLMTGSGQGGRRRKRLRGAGRDRRRGDGQQRSARLSRARRDSMAASTWRAPPSNRPKIGTKRITESSFRPSRSSSAAMPTIRERASVKAIETAMAAKK